jgi:hypothetical protein
MMMQTMAARRRVNADSNLGPSGSRVRKLAAGLIPAVRDANGHYWYRPDHLDLVLRAWRATDHNQTRRHSLVSQTRS